MINYLNTTTYSITWFKKTNDANELQMSPPFQRKPVWTDKQKSYLIDSILNGYPIPEIYIQEKIAEDGSTQYVIVDGQQRIRSVLEFISGSFAIEEGESENWEGMTFDDLSGETKIKFFAYKFVVRCLPEMTDEEVRSIFQRINKNNVKLNDQELRQSTYSGAFINSMNTISDKPYWKDIALFSAEKVRRMQDVEYISEITIAFLNGHQNKKDKLDYYYTLYEKEYLETERVEETFDKVCYEILQILPDIRKTRWNHLVDFYTLFLVLADKVDDIPFSADTQTLHKKLVDFSEWVTLLQKQDNEVEIDNIKAIEYSAGVRNSSDLNSRKKRYNALREYLFPD